MSALPRLIVEQFPHARGLDLPAYASAGAAGFDLRAAVEDDLVIEAGGSASVPTGLRMVLPAGHEGQVRPRSGLAARFGVTVLNAPGTVDEDYRGEVLVLLVNHGSEAFTVRRGERVAQMVVAPVVRVAIEEGTVDADTARGAEGFGSTGVE